MGHPRALLYTLPFALLACTEKLVPLEEVTSTTLGVAGGAAKSAAGELTLDFESGTLAAGTVIRIRTNRDRPNVSLSSIEGFAVYELTADPPISVFSKPVAISIKVKPIGNDLGYVVANFDGAQPVRLASTYDRATQTARAELEHFSSYGAWTGTSTPSACPPSAPSGSDTCSQEGLRCEYGQECCCGECFSSEVWMCSGGSWAGHATDACLGAAFNCPDSGVSPDSGPSSCTGSDGCISCGDDQIFPATCTDGAWTCSQGRVLVSQYDVGCFRDVGGPCGPRGTVACFDNLACGNDDRCHFQCSGTHTSTPAGDHFGRCRGTTGDPQGCCTSDVIDGLCGPGGDTSTFFVCPRDSVLATTCTSTPGLPCN